MTESTHDHAMARGTLMRYAFGAMVSRVVATAAQLDLPDHIADAEVTATDLAERCEADQPALTRLLRCLAGLDIVRETGRNTFALTAAGQLLRRDHPASMRDITLMWAEPAMLDAWRELPTAIREGRRVFDDVFGVDFFGYLGRDPELPARFNAAMAQGSAATARTLPASYDFGRFRTIVDVGGGDGTLLSAILREHPKPHGIVFDSVEGAAQAESVLRDAGVGDRCRVETGDFFDAVPGGGHLYLIKSVIHDWDDAKAATILRNCRAAMPSDGRLLVLEPVLPETVPAPPGPLHALQYLSDLNMLVNLDGRERTAADFADLLRRSGFEPGEILTVPQLGMFRLIQARPA